MHALGPSKSGPGLCTDAAALLARRSLFCRQYAATCGGVEESYSACLAQTGAMTPGKDADTSGDSFSCREYHLSVAVSNPSVHCPHAGQPTF